MRLVCVYGVDKENRGDRENGTDGTNGINGKILSSEALLFIPSSEAVLFILLNGAVRVLKGTKGY